jgi:hypothetical protein
MSETVAIHFFHTYRKILKAARFDNVGPSRFFVRSPEIDLIETFRIDWRRVAASGMRGSLNMNSALWGFALLKESQQ